MITIIFFVFVNKKTYVKNVRRHVWKFATRSDAARMLKRIRAARRWWWTGPLYGSKAFIAPPTGSLRDDWHFFNTPFATITVYGEGHPDKLFKVPRLKRK